MQTLLEDIVKMLVDYPDDIQIKEVIHDDAVSYTLSVRQEDMGKIIGKKGRIAQSIRTVLNAAGANQNKKVFLEIED